MLREELDETSDRVFLGPGEELEEEEQAWQTGEVIVSETRAWTPLQELALMLAHFQD